MRRPGLIVANSCANGRKGLTEQVFLSPGMGCWPWDHQPGDQRSTLGSEGRIQPEACCQSSKGDFFFSVLPSTPLVKLIGGGHRVPPSGLPIG